MTTTTNTQHVVRSGAAFVYLAPVVDVDGAAITQGAVSTLTRTITDPLGTVTTDELSVGDTVHDSAQTNTALWDQTYNFKDDVPATKVTVKGRHRLQYTLAMADGSTIKTAEIDVIGD